MEPAARPGPRPFVNGDEVEAAEKEKRVGNATIEELEDMEDDEGLLVEKTLVFFFFFVWRFKKKKNPDEAVLAKIRAQRLNELKLQAAKARFGSGSLPEIHKGEWKDQVTEAAFSQKVVVMLYKPGEEWCGLLERQLAVVAGRFPRVKFVKIVFTSAIADFPEKSLPCLLIYNKNDPIQQIVGLPYGGGARMTPDDVEWTLHCKGVIKSEMEEDPRTGSAGPDRAKLNYIGAVNMEEY